MADGHVDRHEKYGPGFQQAGRLLSSSRLDEDDGNAAIVMPISPGGTMNLESKKNKNEEDNDGEQDNMEEDNVDEGDGGKGGEV